MDKCCESNEHAEITRLTLRAVEKRNDTYCAWYVSLRRIINCSSKLNKTGLKWSWLVQQPCLLTISLKPVCRHVWLLLALVELWCLMSKQFELKLCSGPKEFAATDPLHLDKTTRKNCHTPSLQLTTALHSNAAFQRSTGTVRPTIHQASCSAVLHNRKTPGLQNCSTAPTPLQQHHLRLQIQRLLPKL